MAKKLTTSAIARELHINQSTVSRALNPERAWMVSAVTRARILAFCRANSGSEAPSPPETAREKTFKVGLVLGSMGHDLAGLGDMIQQLCDLLQSCNYSLTLIRVDFSKKELVHSVKQAIKSNIADVYIVASKLVDGQALELLHSVSPRVILYTMFLSIPGRATEFCWLSSVRCAHEQRQLEIMRKLPDQWRKDICLFGRNNAQTLALADLIRRQGRQCGSNMSGLTTCLYGKCSIPGDLAYRVARLEAEARFDELAGHQLYWAGGGNEGKALADVFLARGLRCGRDFRLISYNEPRTIYTEHDSAASLASFSHNDEKCARMLCELVMSLLDNPVPRHIEIPAEFYPGESLPGIN